MQVYLNLKKSSFHFEAARGNITLGNRYLGTGDLKRMGKLCPPDPRYSRMQQLCTRTEEMGDKTEHTIFSAMNMSTLLVGDENCLECTSK